MSAIPQVFERQLPNSPESERAILASIIIDNQLIEQAKTLLVADQFYGATNRKAFEGMVALADRQSAIDPLVLHEETGIETIWFHNIIHGFQEHASVYRYAQIVREKAALRQLVKISNKLTQAALEEEDPQQLFEAFQQELFTLGIQFHVDSKVKTYGEISKAVFTLFEQWADGKIVALPTQIPELDHRLAYGGLSTQDFIIIAARSSFGKTALALQVGLNVARAGYGVLIVSLEMSGEKLFIRNLSSVSGVPHKKINPWTFQNDRATASQILRAVPKLEAQPIRVEDRIHELSRVGAIAREWKRTTKNPGLVIVDYLQLVKNRQNGRSRQEEVAGVSSEMKRLAQELNVPLIGVSQFNRDPARHNRRPELSDLRESGQLEQDADVVLFPWSEGGLKDEPIRGMKLYCAKQRNGSVGWEIDIDFDGEKQWFFTDQMYREQR